MANFISQLMDQFINERQSLCMADSKKSCFMLKLTEFAIVLNE